LWLAPAALGSGIFLAVVLTALPTIGSASASHLSPAATLATDILFDAAFVAVALVLVSRLGRLVPADFGYRRVRWAKSVGGVLTAAATYYAASAVYAVLVNPPQDKLPSNLGVTRSSSALVGATVFVCVLAPMAEEFFFRGFLFGVLSGMRVPLRGRQAGPWIAALITGLLFGLVHLGSAPVLDLAVLGLLGLILCLLRWWTESLYPCMALHSANNCLALGVQLHWSLVGILGLVLGSWLVIGVVTGPLSLRGPRPA
jgi:membrane protease YdiL (CAAX protease family)